MNSMCLHLEDVLPFRGGSFSYHICILLQITGNDKLVHISHIRYLFTYSSIVRVNKTCYIARLLNYRAAEQSALAPLMHTVGIILNINSGTCLTQHLYKPAFS